MSGMTHLARRGAAASSKLLQTNSKSALTQPKRNLNLFGGYDTQRPSGETNLQKYVQWFCGVSFFAWWLIDRETVQHKWHEYKTGNPYSDFATPWSPPHRETPKPPGRVSRYE